MSSRIIKIIIVVLIAIVVLVGGLFAWAIIGGKAAAPQSGQSSGGVFGTIFSLFNGNSGSNIATSSTPTATIQSDTGVTVTIPRLRQITQAPVAGAAFIQRNVPSTIVDSLGQVKNVLLLQTFIRYVDRAAGHIFETKPDSLAITEVTNTTLPKIYQAIFTNQGNSALYQYLATDENTVEISYELIATSSATTTSSRLGSTSTPKALFSYVLPENISALAISPARDQIFYLRNGGQGGIGTISAANNAKPKQIFNYPLKEWQLGWPKSNTLTLTTKPSANVFGYLFFMNSANGSLTKELGNVLGLTTLTSPDLGSVLFSQSDPNNNDFNLNTYNTKTDAASSLSIKTLPEKCVWSQKTVGLVYCAVPISVSKAIYPDAWYQGTVSFTDNFWKINVNTGERNLVARTADLTKQAIDAVNLSLDPSETYLLFNNKRDLTLWNLLVAEPAGPVVATSTPATIVGTSSSAISSTSTPYTPPTH